MPRNQHSALAAGDVFHCQRFEIAFFSRLFSRAEQAPISDSSRAFSPRGYSHTPQWCGLPPPPWDAGAGADAACAAGGGAERGAGAGAIGRGPGMRTGVTGLGVTTLPFTGIPGARVPFGAYPCAAPPFAPATVLPP